LERAKGKKKEERGNFVRTGKEDTGRQRGNRKRS
jgi:hypothetical protein